MNPKTPLTLAIAALIGVNVLWGMSFPIMKALNEIIASIVHPGAMLSELPANYHVASASFMIAARFSLALLLLAVLMPRLIRDTNRAEWQVGLWLGTLFCCGLILQVIGLASIPASRSGFLTSLTTVYTPLISSLFLRRSPAINVWVGAGLAVAGVLILSNVISIAALDRSGNGVAKVALNWGDACTTLGTLFFSLQLLLVDWKGKQVEGKKHQLQSARFTPGMFLAAAIVAVVVFGLTQGLSGSIFEAAPQFSSHSWSSLLAARSFWWLLSMLAFFCSLLSFLGMNAFQPYVNPSQAAVIYSTEPLFASLWSMCLPGWIAALVTIDYVNEQLTLELIVGGVLVMIANVVALWPQAAKRTSETSETSELKKH
jgi:drug/metabolite transporter (DMT)-like permease